jgi:NTE family protein
VQKLIEDGWLKERYRSQLKNVLIHSIRADKAPLRPVRREQAGARLALSSTISSSAGGRRAGCGSTSTYADLGRRQSVDLRTEFL